MEEFALEGPAETEVAAIAFINLERAEIFSGCVSAIAAVLLINP